MYPLSVEDERAFISDLTKYVSTHKVSTTRSGRDDMTSLIGILRCGGNLQDALVLAPGLKTGALLAAYNKIEKQRLTCVQAWENLRLNPSVANFKKHRNNISKVLPDIVKSLDRAVMLGRDLSVEIRDHGYSVDAAGARAKFLENKCKIAHKNSREFSQITSSLYNPHDTYSAYTDQAYLPDRVGAIGPLKLDNLYK